MNEIWIIFFNKYEYEYKNICTLSYRMMALDKRPLIWDDLTIASPELMGQTLSSLGVSILDPTRWVNSTRLDTTRK
jgi:hypothetical protein